MRICENSASFGRSIPTFHHETHRMSGRGEWLSMNALLPAIDHRTSADAAAATLRRRLWPGKEPLTLADRRRLAGRETQVATLLERLQRPVQGESPVIWLHGDAGVGKTSLALAGVMPKWSADYGQKLVWFHLLPDEEKGGNGLIETVAEGILREAARSDESSLDLVGRMRQFHLLLSENTSEDAAEYLAACFRRSTPQGAVGALFVDQFGRCLEGLIRRDDPEVSALLRFLRDLSLTGTFPLLIGLRSFQRPKVAAALAEAGMTDFGEWVKIEAPPVERLHDFLASAPSARHVVGRMELSAPLHEELKEKVAANRAILPLVSEMLAAISLENPDADQIDTDMVEWFGGLDRVFAEAGERAFAAVTLVDVAELEAAFDRLMALIEASRDGQAQLDEIAPETDPVSRNLVMALINERVLQLSGDSPSEARVAWTYPEGLRQWERSSRWLAEKERLEARIARFEGARERWEAEHRTPVCLIHASRLIGDARQLLDRNRLHPFLEAPLIEFLEESIDLDQRLRGEIQETKTRRLWWIGGSAAAVILFVFVMIAMGG